MPAQRLPSTLATKAMKTFSNDRIPKQKRHTATPVTRDEVLRVLDSGEAYTASRIGVLVWHGRGGTGNLASYTSKLQRNVSVVRYVYPQNVANIIQELLNERVIAVVDGDDVSRPGKLYHRRAYNGVYYRLVRPPA